MDKKPLILVVDDEKDLLEIMATKLSSEGFDVKTAGNGDAAYQATKEFKPDLILMDINMPGGPTGTDAALRIKQDPDIKDTRIAFLSNVKDPWPAIVGERKDVASVLGMEDFLDKTDDINVNVEKIRAILERK